MSRIYSVFEQIITKINIFEKNFLKKSGGTMSGTMDMGSQKITNLATPTAAGDAANKKYVDGMLPKTGGTMTGSLHMSNKYITDLATPGSPGDAANKKYVDDSTSLLRSFPVGAIYISVTNTSPASLFGGTWTQLKDRFLIGAGGAYGIAEQGGAKEVTLNINQIPTHDHNIEYLGGMPIGFSGNDNQAAWNGRTVQGTYNGAATGYKFVAQPRGGGAAHNNMPPYLAVFMWKRTA